MIKYNEKLKEYDSIYLFDTSRYKVIFVDNEDDKLYFTVIDNKDISKAVKLCRIYMDKPSYVGEDDESIFIELSDIYEIMEKFNMVSDNIWNNYSDISIWEALIRYINDTREINCSISDIPDYTKL